MDHNKHNTQVTEALLAACLNRYPTTRIDLLTGDDARGFRKYRLV